MLSTRGAGLQITERCSTPGPLSLILRVCNEPRKSIGSWAWKVNNDLNFHLAQSLLFGSFLSILGSRERFPNQEADLFCHSIRVLFTPVEKDSNSAMLMSVGKYVGISFDCVRIPQERRTRSIAILGSHLMHLEHGAFL